jgi:HEAT repeat protein
MTTALVALDEQCLALASIGAAATPTASELANLRAALGADTSLLRTTAARALGALLARGSALGGRLADEISRELAQIAVRDPHLWARRTAAAALAHATNAALESLEAALRDNAVGVRERAARAIGPWGQGDASEAAAGRPPTPRARVAELALVAALEDAHYEVRAAAAETLGTLPVLGPSLGALATMARGPAPSGLRIAAFGALADAGAVDHDLAFEALETTLTNAGSGAARATGEPAPRDETDQLLVAALEAALATRRPDRATRLTAPLLGLLRSPSEPDAVRIAALRALGSLGAEAAGALDDVLAAASHRSWTVREQAFEAFGELAAGNPSIVEARLPAIVASRSSGERYVGLRLLHRLGAVPEGLVPAIWEVALEDPDLRTRDLARELVGAFGPGSALPKRLSESLTSGRSTIRARAAELARRLGPAASPLVPALVGALPDPSRKVRRSAVQALGAIGPAALPGVPPTIRRAFEREATVAEAARASLKVLAPELASDLRARVAAAVERGSGEALLLKMLVQGLPEGLEADFLRVAEGRARWHGSLHPEAPVAPTSPTAASAVTPASPTTASAAAATLDAPSPDVSPVHRAALAAMAAADEAAGRRRHANQGAGARQREAAWLLAFLVRELMARGR